MAADEGKSAAEASVAEAAAVLSGSPAALSASEIWSAVERRFPITAAPLLHAQMSEFAGKPYEGLRLLHNVPITLSTLFKIRVLVAAGAHVTAVEPVFVPSDPKAVALLRRCEECGEAVRYLASHEEVAGAGAFDAVLDCCAELAERTVPRLGAAELTQTGDVRYRDAGVAWPVISVDDSRVKRVEDALGSSDGFMRAMVHQLGEETPLTGRVYVVVGFGKVGLGLAHRLSELEGSSVVVVERDAAARERAAAAGYTAVDSEDVDAVLEAVRGAWCVVTATGVPRLMTNVYGKTPEARAAFEGKVLVNIGADDEWGDAFTSTGAVLFDGRAVNFSLEEPTTIEYLDCAFVAQNACVQVLLDAAKDAAEGGDGDGKVAAGVRALPGPLDARIITAWAAAHPDQVPTLRAVVGPLM